MDQNQKSVFAKTDGEKKFLKHLKKAFKSNPESKNKLVTVAKLTT